MATAPVRRLDANNDATFGRGIVNYATGPEATVQRLRSRIRLILGEWFLDTSAGTPWWQPEDSDVPAILGGPRNLSYAEAVLKDVILGTDGIASLESIEMSVDTATRRLTVTATVVSDEGDVVSITEVSP